MRIVKIIIVVSLGVLIGFGFFQGIQKSDLTKLSDITIEGASPQTEARLREILGFKAGDSFWKISVEKEAAKLKTDPWVENADVRKKLPHSLAISITERKPFALLGDGRGDFKFVDAKGTIIDRAEPTHASQYPILMASDFERRQDLRTQGIELLKSLPEEGLVSLSDVSEVQFNDEHGFQLTLMKTGMVIDLGKDNLPLRVDRARRVVQYLDRHQINATHIDSDYAKKVLVKVRKGR